jgi:hypothetical protein
LIRGEWPFTSCKIQRETINVRRLHAWLELPALTADDFAQIIGQHLSVVEDQPEAVIGGIHAASLSLLKPMDASEVRLSVIVEDSMLDWFRETLLGDVATDDAATQDALRELANTTGGCFKRAALAEGITLTSGLPVDGPGSYVYDLSADRRRFSLIVGSNRIVVVADIVNQSPVRVCASDLLEGMVPRHDVCADSGVVLVAAGSRLTETSVANIARNVSPQIYIEVCAPN